MKPFNFLLTIVFLLVSFVSCTTDNSKNEEDVDPTTPSLSKKITLTTDPKIEVLKLAVLSHGDNAWVDLNNNKKKDIGEEIPTGQAEVRFNLENNKVNLYGDIYCLWCEYNELTNIDLSQNTQLEVLDCSSNSLTHLDVSENIALYDLDCTFNEIMALDVSKNENMQTLMCYNNKLKALDVSKNHKLLDFFCYENELEKLNVANGNNEKFNIFKSTNNPNLTCIQIDPGFEPPSGWKKDEIAEWSHTSCM